MNWYIKVIKNYAVFTGRARRMEFWMFMLVNFMISVGCGVVAGVFGAPSWTPILYSLAVLVPGIAVRARRLHDTNHSGWWMLVPIYNLVLYCFDGESHDNRFGPDPKKDSVRPLKRAA